MPSGNGTLARKGLAKNKREQLTLILHQIEQHLNKLNQNRVTKKQVQESLTYLVDTFDRCLRGALISITAFKEVWSALVDLGVDSKDKEKVWSAFVRFQDLILKEDKRLLDLINAE